MTAACLTACGDSASTADTEKTESNSSQAQSESVADSESKTESTADSESKADSKADTSSDSDSSTTEEKQEEKEVLLKIENYESDQLRSYTVYSYNYDAGEHKYIRTTTNHKISGQNETEESGDITDYNEELKVICSYFSQTKQISDKFEYNQDGKVSKRTSYNSNGTIREYVVYEYGNDVVTETTYGNDNKVLQTKKKEYSDNKLIKESTSPMGFETVYKYNDKGELITKDSTNDVIAHESYKYEYSGDNGYKQTVTRTEPDGKTYVSEEKTYNGKGQLINTTRLKNHYMTKYYYGKLPK